MRQKEREIKREGEPRRKKMWKPRIIHIKRGNIKERE